MPNPTPRPVIDRREAEARECLDALHRTGVRDEQTLRLALVDDYGFSGEEAVTYYFRWATAQSSTTR